MHDWPPENVVGWLIANPIAVCDFENPRFNTMTVTSHSLNPDGLCDYRPIVGVKAGQLCNAPGKRHDQIIRCEFHKHPIFILLEVVRKLRLLIPVDVPQIPQVRHVEPQQTFVQQAI